MKSIIRKRRELGVVCPICKSPDYALLDTTTPKPTFVCNSCNNHWQYGIGGGIYMQYLGNENENIQTTTEA